MEKWNYEITFNPNLGDLQKDWNQTLLTKFNYLTIGVDKEILIKVPNKFKDLIESLTYYDQFSNKISNRYNVIFFESEENIIYLDKMELEIENY
jgi:hypothetical protein